MIVDVPIRISPHKSLNFKKGIIRSRGLRGCSDDEILKGEGTKEQGITAVKRFKIKKQGDLVDTDTFLIYQVGISTYPCRNAHSKPTEMFRVPKIWTP